MSSLKKRSATAYAWDIGGTVARQGSGFIISIFLARLLDPAEFGLVGMAMVFISISQVFIDVGFSSALIQNRENTNLTYNSVFYLNIVAGVLLTVVFYFIAPFVGAFYENSQITGLVKWLSLIFILNSFNIVQQTILQKKLNFKVLTLRTIIANVSGGILGVIFALKGYGVNALVIQQLSSAFLSTILLWSASSWKPDFKFSFSEVKKLTGFSAYVFFDRFVSTIFQRLDIILIGKIFSPASLGFYTRAVSLKDQVTKYSSSSLTRVFYPVLSGLQDDQNEYSRIYFKVVSVIAFISYALTGVLYILGKEIILLLFGLKWMESVPIFEVLILAACNRPLNSIMINAFMSKGKSRENFIIGLGRKAIVLIPLSIAYFYGIYYYTVSFVITSYVITTIHIFLMQRLLDLSMKKHFVKVFEGAIPVLIVIIFNTYLSAIIPTPYLFAFLFLVFYLLFNYLIKSEGLVFLFTNIKERFSK